MRVINMKKNILSISVIAIVLLTSCTNFLDIKPYGKTIPKTPDEFASLLHTYLSVSYTHLTLPTKRIV